MSDPIDELNSFFSTSKVLKAKGKVIISFDRVLNEFSSLPGFLSPLQTNHRLQKDKQTTVG